MSQSQENTRISFVGQKISKICWCVNRDGSVNSNEFLTGGWDENRNFLTQWRVPSETPEHGTAFEPYVISQMPQDGSITDISYLTPDKILCSTSVGEVSIISIDNYTNVMEQNHKWSKLHQYNVTKEAASCCCIAASENEIITGGEDGRINILQVDRKKPVRVLENADSSNITGLQFLSSKEIVTINTTGQLKVWDIRQQNSEQPQKILTLTGNACPLLSLDKHPNQPHILVTGHGDGVIGIWDIRQEKAPVTLIDAHEAEVWQVKFHPLYPDNLFTCSEDGSCWFWDGTSMISGANYIKSMNEASGRFNITPQVNETLSSSVWLYIDANKHKMETFSLIPFNKSAVNSFDVDGSSLICGTDNEAVIIVNDIPVR